MTTTTPAAPEKAAETTGRKIQVQDSYLQKIVKERTNVSIYLINGIKLQGIVTQFDQYALILRGTHDQLAYKHAIATIVPGTGQQRDDRTPRSRDR